MDISIFEDQTGLKLYPEVRSDKDNKIISFFNNNVDLYIDKTGNNLTAYCHLIAYRATSRPLGYFVIYKDDYKDNFFANLKKDITKVINDLDLKPRTGHIDNLIFENIQKFDDLYQYNKEDTDAVVCSINRGRNLGYSTSNIREISAFSNNILRNIDNIKISISSSENELGDINFLIDKKNGEILKQNAKTIQTINESKEILIEKKKSKTGEPGRNKIDEGFIKIKEGTDVLKNAGYSDIEIIKEIDKKLNEYVPIYRKKLYEIEEKSEKSKEVIIEKKEQEKTNPYTKAMIIFFGILAISAILMYIFYPEQMNEKFNSIKGKLFPYTPVVVETPSIIPSTTETPNISITETPVQIVIPTSTTNASVTPNKTSGNGTNASGNGTNASVTPTKTGNTNTTK